MDIKSNHRLFGDPYCTDVTIVEVSISCLVSWFFNWYGSPLDKTDGFPSLEAYAVSPALWKLGIREETFTTALLSFPRSRCSISSIVKSRHQKGNFHHCSCLISLYLATEVHILSWELELITYLLWATKRNDKKKLYLFGDLLSTAYNT